MIVSLLSCLYYNLLGSRIRFLLVRPYLQLLMLIIVYGAHPWDMALMFFL